MMVIGSGLNLKLIVSRPAFDIFGVRFGEVFIGPLLGCIKEM